MSSSGNGSEMDKTGTDALRTEDGEKKMNREGGYNKQNCSFINRFNRKVFLS